MTQTIFSINQELSVLFSYSSLVEEGLQVHLIGKNGQECSTGHLDNSELYDYDSIAKFTSTILRRTDNQGLGECDNVKVYF